MELDGGEVVFRALADATRRELLDRLREHNGQNLSELCGGLEMRRQSVSQHLQVLEAANLVTTHRAGRTKLHYLNPVPIEEIGERWIGRFERRRLHSLRSIRRQAEEEVMPTPPDYRYVSYIAATPERIFEALTSADLTASYWGHANVSEWTEGSPWEHVRVDGSGIADARGIVVGFDPPFRLVLTFAGDPEEDPGQSSKVTFLIEPYHDICRLTVTHERLGDEEAYHAIEAGWPAVMANLKSLLETGHVMAQPPWEMHAELRAARMRRNDRRSGS